MRPQTNKQDFKQNKKKSRGFCCKISPTRTFCDVKMCVCMPVTACQYRGEAWRSNFLPYFSSFKTSCYHWIHRSLQVILQKDVLQEGTRIPRKIILLSFEKLVSSWTEVLEMCRKTASDAARLLSRRSAHNRHLYQNKFKLVFNSRCAGMVQQCRLSLFMESTTLIQVNESTLVPDAQSHHGGFSCTHQV